MSTLRTASRFLLLACGWWTSVVPGQSTSPSAVIALRPAADRPEHDDARLQQAGIHRYESRRMVLYSDIDPAQARPLPALIDAVYPHWIAYFGELAPAADGSEFRLIAYLMRDRGLFRELGLLPEDLVAFQHGQHRGYRFWMAEQNYDYYRRHLFLHEATHCFMMIEPQRERPPLFYLEGMAELFGTHVLEPDGTLRTRVFPDDPEEEVGFGRVEMIARAIAAGRRLTLRQVWELGAREFSESREDPYAWSWAACAFLDTHPRYRERFRSLAAIRDGAEFRRELELLYAADAWDLEREWELFTRTLAYGYDIERAAINWQAGRPLPGSDAPAVAVLAGRGWQSSGVAVEADATYRVKASGEVVLATKPKAWLSHPDGVTIRYSGGWPVGRVLALIVPDAATEPCPEPVDVGRSTVIRAPCSGTLYLRINDAWDSLVDNSGRYLVTIQRSE